MQILPDDTRCCSCNIVLIEPILLSCRHTFCPDCVEIIKNKNHNKCLIDQEETYGYLIDKYIKAKVFNVLICCLNDDDCNWKGKLDEFVVHNDICEFKYISCELKCKKNIQRRHMINHVQNNCLERLIICNYCNKELQFKSQSNHLENECYQIKYFDKKVMDENITIDYKNLKDIEMTNIQNTSNEIVLMNEKINIIIEDLNKIKNENVVIKEEQNQLKQENILLKSFSI